MNGAFRLALVFQVLVNLLSTSAAQAESDQELLQLVRDAHRAARESIQTLSCRVEFAITITQKTKPAIMQSCSSRYWFSPTAMRAKITENNEDTDYLWGNSVQTYVIRREIGGQLAATAGRGHFAHRHFKRCDPFVRGLLVFHLPNTADFLPFEELVERATKFKKAERKQVGGRELIIVQLFFDSSKKNDFAANVDIYFDPSVNYLVRQMAYSYSTHRMEDEVLEFKEYTPGLFFPAQVMGHSQTLTKRVNGFDDSKTKFSDVRINQPLPRDIFNFKFPHGVSLFDQILGCEYQVDADGNPISQQTPYGQEPPPPIKSGDVQAFGTETQAEPRPWSRWILPISFGILIAGGIAAFLRRRRRQAEST